MKLSALYIVLDNHEWKHKDADLKSLIVVQFRQVHGISV